MARKGFVGWGSALSGNQRGCPSSGPGGVLAEGILQKARALLFARPHRYPEEAIPELYEWIKKVLWEYGREDLPVVVNMDFGHTSPQFVLPFGVQLEVNPKTKTIRMLEPAVQ